MRVPCPAAWSDRRPWRFPKHCVVTGCPAFAEAVSGNARATQCYSRFNLRPPDGVTHCHQYCAKTGMTSLTSWCFAEQSASRQDSGLLWVVRSHSLFLCCRHDINWEGMDRLDNRCDQWHCGMIGTRRNATKNRTLLPTSGSVYYHTKKLSLEQSEQYPDVLRHLWELSQWWNCVELPERMQEYSDILLRGFFDRGMERLELDYIVDKDIVIRTVTKDGQEQGRIPDVSVVVSSLWNSNALTYGVLIEPPPLLAGK